MLQFMVKALDSRIDKWSDDQLLGVGSIPRGGIP